MFSKIVLVVTIIVATSCKKSREERVSTPPLIEIAKVGDACFATLTKVYGYQLAANDVEFVYVPCEKVGL